MVSRQSDWQKKQRDMGNCIKCGKPRAEGSSHYCERHQTLSRDGVREIRKQRREQGKCNYCDNPAAVGRCCEKHAKRKREINRDYYEKQQKSGMIRRAFMDICKETMARDQFLTLVAKAEEKLTE